MRRGDRREPGDHALPRIGVVYPGAGKTWEIQEEITEVTSLLFHNQGTQIIEYQCMCPKVTVSLSHKLDESEDAKVFFLGQKSFSSSNEV